MTTTKIVPGTGPCLALLGHTIFEIFEFRLRSQLRVESGPCYAGGGLVHRGILRAVTHRIRYIHTLDFCAREQFPREARSRVTIFVKPNHAECNILANQSWTYTNSSWTTRTCADKVVKTSQKFERYTTAIAYSPLRPTSEPSPAPVTWGSGNSLSVSFQNHPGSAFAENPSSGGRFS